MANYLLKRGNLWWVQRKFPVDVKDQLGTFFRKSLATDDETQARAAVVQRMREFDALIAQVRLSRDEGDLFANADENPALDQMLARYQGQVLSGLSNAAQRRHLRVLEAFGEFVGLGLTAQQVSQRGRAVVEQWLLPTYGHTDAGRRALNVLIAFYDWVVDSGYAQPPNAFSGYRIKPIKSVVVSRKAWTAEECERVLSSLLAEAERPANVLARDNAWRLAWVVLLGLFSGDTLHQVCEAQRQSQFKDLPASWHKTRAAWPEVDSYWVPGLSPGGPDGRRSWQLQKALGRRLTSLPGSLTYTGLRHAANNGVKLDFEPWLARLQAIDLTPAQA
ncbi:MAG: DUF6538 domain-containing protein [Litorivicinus sp.]